MPESPTLVATPTLFHVTHWKAGSQWIRKILHELEPERVVAPRSGEGQFLYDDIVAGGIYPTVYVTKEQYDAVAPPEPARRFVVLRGLRDTVVSAYFSFRYSHGLISRDLVKLRAQLEMRERDEGMLFLIENWLPAAASIQASWLAADEPVLWYEDLLRDDLGLLHEALVRRGGLRVGDARLREVIEANRFAALTGGRPAGEEDTRAHARKGISGDWENHFSARVARRFEELYGALDAAAPCGRAGATRPAGGAARRAAEAPGTLTNEEVLAGFDAVVARHPNLPTYSLWLAWELAALRRLRIGGRVLDLGCSDPAFFQLGQLSGAAALGVAADPTFLDWARQSGVYADVQQVDSLERFAESGGALLHDLDGVYTRTTLSTAEHVEDILAQVLRSLRPGGTFVCTVLTERYHDWALLPRLFDMAGHEGVAEQVHREHLAVHGIRDALPASQWDARFAAAGFEIADRLAILPHFMASVFLLFDTLWHRPAADGRRVGDEFTAWLSARPQVRAGLRSVLAALLELEPRRDEGAAMVYALRKPAG